MKTITARKKIIKQYRNKRVILPIIISVYLLAALFHICFMKNNDKIAILGFHNVVRDEVKRQEYPYNMWVESESVFRERIAYLYEQGYTTWTMQELYEWKCEKRKKPEKVVVLTFDDGYRSSKDIIAPILKEYGYRGTTFVVGSLVKQADETSIYLSEEDLKDQETMEYYSHTYQMHDHYNNEYAVDHFSKQQLQKDYEQQMSITDCSYVAYPFGHYNTEIISVLEENGVKLAFGYHENRKASKTDHAYTLPRFSVNAYTTMDTMKAMLESE